MAATGLAGSISVIQLDTDHASLTRDIGWRVVVALTTRVVSLLTSGVRQLVIDMSAVQHGDRGLLTALADAQQRLDEHASAAEPPLVGPIPCGGPRPCPR